MPVVASASAEYQGLQVMIQMDKEYYEEDEPITATITVVNTNSQSVTIVNLEQLIPEGYILAEDSQASTQNVVISSGETIQLQVTFMGDPAKPAAQGEGTFWDKVFYGETLGIPNIILLVIVLIGIVVFMALT